MEIRATYYTVTVPHYRVPMVVRSSRSATSSSRVDERDVDLIMSQTDNRVPREVATRMYVENGMGTDGLVDTIIAIDALVVAKGVPVTRDIPEGVPVEVTCEPSCDTAVTIAMPDGRRAWLAHPVPTEAERATFRTNAPGVGRDTFEALMATKDGRRALNEFKRPTERQIAVERARIARLDERIAYHNGGHQLSNPVFLERAPAAFVAAVREKVEGLQAERRATEARLARLLAGARPALPV